MAAGALVSHPTAVLAQSDAEIALARKHFKEAEAAEAKKDFRAALALFEKAAAIKETPQISLRIGGCHEKLGELTAALARYERAQEKAELAKLPDVVSIARELADGVRQRVAVLTVAPKEAYPDLRLVLDGRPIAVVAVGDKLPLDPGDHVLRVEATGRKPFEQRFKVAERESKTVAVTLELDPDAATPSTGPSAPGAAAPARDQGAPSGGPRIAPIVLLAGGGAAVAGGAVLFVLSIVKDGDIDDRCGGAERKACPKSQQADIESDVSTVNTFRVLSVAIGGAGLVAAGIGVVVLASAPSASPSRESALSVAPSVGPRWAGVSAAGRF